MYQLDKSSNAVFSLVYHLIIIVKYRKKVFTTEEILSRAKTLMEKASDEFGVQIIEQECGEDHIHILFRAKPTLELTKYVNILKGHSSRALRKEFPEHLKNKLWGDSFWSPSYFLATTGNVTIDILRKYIESQRDELGNAESV